MSKTTETLDKLYLEWSQFTTARTGRELALERALLIHGRHDVACRWRDTGGLCDCPYGDALASFGLSRPGVGT